jgi:outer membrane protein
MKKSILIAASLLLCLVLVSGLILAQSNSTLEAQIGYVNMEKLFAEHPARETSEAELHGEAEKLREELQSQAGDISEEERQQLLEEYQGQLNELEQQLVEEVMADISKKVSQVAEEKGIKVVLAESAVITGGYNLTEDVLAVIETEENSEQTQD